MCHQGYTGNFMVSKPVALSQNNEAKSSIKEVERSHTCLWFTEYHHTLGLCRARVPQSPLSLTTYLCCMFYKRAWGNLFKIFNRVGVERSALVARTADYTLTLFINLQWYWCLHTVHQTCTPLYKTCSTTVA